MLGVTDKFPRKRAFVTGGASGLGRGICQHLARDGWKIGIADYNAERLAEAEKEMTDLGGEVFAYELDVTDRERFKEVADDFLDKAQGIDLLFNNAGVAAGGLFSEYSLEDWDWLMDIDFMSVVNGTKFFQPAFLEQRSGHIINTASAAALFPVPRMTAYCCAKTAVKMFSEILHNEMNEYGIGVTVFMPEFFRTNLHETARGGEVESAKYMLETADYGPEEVSEYLLKCVAAGDLWVTFPGKVRVMWWLIRIAPGYFLKVVKQQMESRRAYILRKLGTPGE